MNTTFNTLPTIVYLDPKNELQIIRAELTNDLGIAIDLINLGDLAVTGVSFSVIFYDENYNPLFNGNSVLYEIKNLNIKPGKIFYLNSIKIDKKYKKARFFSIKITEIYLEDSKNIVYANKYKFLLPIIPESKRKKLKEAFGEQFISYGENTPNGWRCVCGAFNPKDQYECKNCSRNKDFVLSNLTEPLINLKLLSLINESGNIDLKNKKAINQLTQTQMVKIASDTKTLDKSRINNISNEKKEMSKSLRITLYSLASIAILVLSFFLVSFYNNFRNDKKYENAKTYIENGQYELALKNLNDLKYNDKYEITPLIDKTNKLINSQLAYKRGLELSSEYDYIEAIKYFKKVIAEDKINYEKSQSRITEIEGLILNQAQNHIDNKDYKNAIYLLDEYLSVVDESAKAQTLRDSLLKYNKGQYIDEYDINEDLEMAKNRADINNKAESLINTFQRIVNDDASLREEPSLKSKLITQLPIDSEVYIINTKIEGIERIWCQVKSQASEDGKSYEGWITANSIQNKDS
jgi:hypothetical protein